MLQELARRDLVGAFEVGHVLRYPSVEVESAFVGECSTTTVTIVFVALPIFHWDIEIHVLGVGVGRCVPAVASGA